VALAASIVRAAAGPCTSDIEGLEGKINAMLAARAQAGPAERESAGALLHRQPTPKSVGEAERKVDEVSAEKIQSVERAMASARAADAAGDKGACEAAVAAARQAIGPSDRGK
jgi:hypothetical protein